MRMAAKTKLASLGSRGHCPGSFGLSPLNWPWACSKRAPTSMFMLDLATCDSSGLTGRLGRRLACAARTGCRVRALFGGRLLQRDPHGEFEQALGRAGVLRRLARHLDFHEFRALQPGRATAGVAQELGNPLVGLGQAGNLHGATVLADGRQVDAL